MTVEQFISKVLGICRIGLKFTTDDFARENYEELEQLGLEVLRQSPELALPKNLYERNIYPTPNCSVRVLTVNEEGHLLMVKEAQDGKWTIPGGWCDLFESSSISGVREVKQETSLDVEIERLLGVFQRERYKDYPTMISEYVHYYSAKICGGTLKHNHETLDVGFFPITALPELSDKVTLSELLRAYRTFKEELPTQFD